MEIDMSFTILPLDEEVFDIDANTRIISVPAKFKQGAGVTGDHLAEIIFFAIDRYFDNTDLTTKKVHIEYSNAKGDKIIATTYPGEGHFFLDPKHPGKIIFGWPLSKLATQDSGTIEFAVRFYSFADVESQILNFSFSTLPARLSINKTMNFVLDNTITKEEYTTEIKTRFVGAGGADIDTAKALAPGWFINIDDTKVYTLAPIQVEAYSPDTGKISYIWKKSINEGESWSDEINAAQTEKLIPTKDESRIEHKLYWKRVIGDDGQERIVLHDGSVPANDGSELYEKVSELTPDTIGMYRVTAINTVGRTSETSYSKIATVPSPQMPTYDAPVLSHIYDSSDITLRLSNIQHGAGEITYKWNDAEEYTKLVGNEITKTISAIGEYKLVVRNTLNGAYVENEFIYEVTPPPATPVINNAEELNRDEGYSVNETITVNWACEEPQGKISFKWYQNEQLIEGANSNSYTPTTSGGYRVEVINTLNGISKITSSGWILVR